MTKVRYTVIITKVIQRGFALAKIGKCIDRRYRPGLATLYEFVRNSEHKADDDFYYRIKALRLG